MHDTTLDRDPFPDDGLRQILGRLARYGGLFEPHDHGGVRISFSEILALGELAKGGALTQQELGDALGLEKSTVSRLASGLESRGWVARERDPGNRRYVRIRLTGTGRETAEVMGAHLRERHDELLAALTPEERRALLVGLSALVRVLDEHRHEL